MITDSTHRSSRRTLLASAGLGMTAACLTSLGARSRAQEVAAAEGPVAMIRGAAGTSPVNIQALRGNISVIMGSGGNIGVLPGADGKLLVDAGIPASKAKILARLQELGREPIRYLINTHWHFDHTDGNDWIHAEGATLIAHTNTRKRLSTPTRVAGWRFTFPPRAAGAIPSITFSPRMSLHLNGEEVNLEYYAPAHTDSDVCVHFPSANVLHVGDTWWNGYYPFIDYSTGGSIDGTIEAAEVNITKVSEDTLVIPGHGPVGGRADLIRFRDMLVTVRDRVATLKKQGNSLKETLAQKPTDAFDASWGGFAINGATFTELVYAGV